MAATTFPTVAVKFHKFVYNDKYLISRIWWYLSMFMNYISIDYIISRLSMSKNLFFNTVYCFSYENFNPADEINFSICEHKTSL